MASYIAHVYWKKVHLNLGQHLINLQKLVNLQQPDVPLDLYWKYGKVTRGF